MTKKKYHSSKSEFSDWLREQTDLDSSKGTIIQDIDFMVYNLNKTMFIAIEEKCFMNDISLSQRTMMGKYDYNFKYDKEYRGYFVIKFERSSPDDGKIYINNGIADLLITKENLIKLLNFTAPDIAYEKLKYKFK